MPATASMAITTIIAINMGFEELVGLFTTDPDCDEELDGEPVGELVTV